MLHCLLVPAGANEYLCEHGGLDLIVQMMKTDSIADGVRQAVLYCISAVIEENGINCDFYRRDLLLYYITFTCVILYCIAGSVGSSIIWWCKH